MGISASVRIWELFSALEACVSLQRCSQPRRREMVRAFLSGHSAKVCEWVRRFGSRTVEQHQHASDKNSSSWQFKLAVTWAMVWGENAWQKACFFVIVRRFQVEDWTRKLDFQADENTKPLKRSRKINWKSRNTEQRSHPLRETVQRQQRVLKPSRTLSLTVDDTKAFLQHYARFLLLLR